MEEGWQPHDRGHYDDINRGIVKRMPSIISDKTPCDPCHWPTSRGRLAGDGLLEMIPLTREEHRKLDLGDTWTVNFVCRHAPAYFRRIYMKYRFTDRYLGPPERVEEIRAQLDKPASTTITADRMQLALI